MMRATKYLPMLDNERTRDIIIRELRSFFDEAGLDRAVLGLSGGVDSSTTLMLVKEAIGPENTYVYLLPSRTTSQESIANALRMVKVAGIPEDNYRIINIEPILKTFTSALGITDRVVRGNTAARTRMTILYAEAKRLGAAVIGTGDRSEWLIGYFTKYGDGAADIFPIMDIYKTQLRRFAEYLGVPPEIAYRPSTPELWEGQTAEGELGLSYETIDDILYLIFDEGLSREEVVEKGFNERDVDLVLELHRRSEHKRRMPKIISVRG